MVELFSNLVKVIMWILHRSPLGNSFLIGPLNTGCLRSGSAAELLPSSLSDFCDLLKCTSACRRLAGMMAWTHILQLRSVSLPPCRPAVLIPRCHMLPDNCVSATLKIQGKQCPNQNWIIVFHHDRCFGWWQQGWVLMVVLKYSGGLLSFPSFISLTIFYESLNLWKHHRW